MKRNVLVMLVAVAAALPALVEAASLSDPFSIRKSLTLSPAKAMLQDKSAEEDPCGFGALGTPLGLTEAVERSLCHNPRTREAWANAKAQAAVLGVRKSEYLPQVSATLGLTKQRSETDVKDIPLLDQDSRITSRASGLKMSLVLADFGLRSAHVEQAQALLDAANSTHDAVLQDVFIATSQAYFDAVSAYAALDAAVEAEKAARESFMAAEAKFKAGVGMLTDQLQAQTAYSQARLDRIKAEGELKNTLGVLATAMGLPANAPVVLAKRDGAMPDTTFVKSVEELLDEARQNHPSLAAARSQWDAAKANVKATKAEGRPTVLLASEISRTEQQGQPLSLGFGQTEIDTLTRNRSLGIQVNIPLFEGFGRTYRVQSAQGQADAKAAEIDKIEQQVMLDVWKNYQQLNAESENIKASDELVKNATEAFNVAQGRYKAGVGNILELLNVQSAVANAKQQRIKSVASWHSARLKLAASVGRIGLWAIAGADEHIGVQVASASRKTQR